VLLATDPAALASVFTVTDGRDITTDYLESIDPLLRQFHDYLVGTLSEAAKRALAAYGDELIRERGFAVNLELLLKLTSTGSSVCEVPTTNDWTQRGGESKLQTGQTLRAYFRVMRAHRENRRLRTPLLLPDPGPTR